MGCPRGPFGRRGCPAVVVDVERRRTSSTVFRVFVLHNRGGHFIHNLELLTKCAVHSAPGIRRDDRFVQFESIRSTQSFRTYVGRPQNAREHECDKPVPKAPGGRVQKFRKLIYQFRSMKLYFFVLKASWRPCDFPPRERSRHSWDTSC